MQARPPSPRPSDVARPAELWAVLPAVPDSVIDTRRLLEEWLRDLRWPAKERIDIVVAVNEALTNVVDHAYLRDSLVGRAQLYVWEAVEQGQRRIVVVITDYGRWKPAAVDADYRCRGLSTMATRMDSLHIEATPRGTTVVMSSATIKLEQRHGHVDAHSEGTTRHRIEALSELTSRLSQPAVG
jgi:anti-sigma regulatory factor (Ser/Thr protein kinase)